MKPLVYLAGPYTTPAPVGNVHRAIYVASDLLESGLVVPFVPHLTCLWDLVDPQPYETWLAYDLEVLAHCDALYRLSGESPGADREMAFAIEHSIPTFIDQGELFTWAIRLEPMDTLRRGQAAS